MLWAPQVDLPEPRIAAALKRFLDPVDRVSEAVFGLIMALTFTCTLSVAGEGREEVRTMIVGALGCNIAWGLVDGIMHLMANFVERGRGLLTLRAIRSASGPEEAHRIIRGSLPPLASSALSEDGVESMRRGLAGLTAVPSRPALSRDDWLGALGLFLWCFVITFPVVIPFMLIGDPGVAMRVSNAVAVLLLFAGGFVLGRHAAHRPWLMGLTLAFVGSVLVVVTIALGG